MNTIAARKFQQAFHLSHEDAAALSEITYPAQTIGSRQDIVSEGSQLTSVPLILQGWAARYRVLENGRKQITALYLPGDFCFPHDVLPHRVGQPIGSLTPVMLARIPLETLRNLSSRSAHLDEALRWDALVAGSIQSEWTVSLGQRTAVERVGHLLCEVFLRLKAVGLTSGDQCEMPITQADLGDLLGLSNVHINRTLRDLRASGLVTLKGRQLVLHDFDGLAAASLFDPGYLQFRCRSTGPA
ncbi:Crp/Fnr family transcriptional regulator [Methylobacterium sp. 17Sr1-1]|uniref:Crp/Fnr family transcriptional regulator n=1 Tax=Methylobacterium sp. 17Sr1-1 TaxID=2202826 RepID=UPI000D6F83B5|nr:Crp/Fnr family transcriptional regulator [Methylobacterium sp. 17Sr1-1]AWN51070.1 cyclic nucleotide-binding protein [Methylobacterium sp. 17Sr1-1]